jgi:hypothetical protein
MPINRYIDAHTHTHGKENNDNNKKKLNLVSLSHKKKEVLLRLMIDFLISQEEES